MSALGWLIAAGIIGAALSSHSTTERTTDHYYIVQSQPTQDYGPRIPLSHRRCENCGGTDTSVYVVGYNSSFVKLKFVCRNCGRSWFKSYRIDQ
jgi:ribosomal protein S27AE